MRPRSPYAGLICIACIAAAVYAAAPNSYFLDIATLAGINAIACVGLNLLVGYAGQVSLGHAAFFAVGAYTPTILAQRCDVPILAGIVGGSIIAAGLAYGLARPILRLKGHYLAMATLCVGVIISIIINTESRWTGGADGLDVPPLTLAGLVIAGERAWFWIVTAALCVVTWVSLNLIDSGPGRVLRAVRGSEFAARAAGIDTQRAKIFVFVLSAVLASLAGSMFAHYVGFVTPAKSGFLKSVELVTMVVLGGLASVYGAIVGAVLLTLLPQLLTAFDDYQLVVLGAIMVATMLFMPRGIVPSLSHLVVTARREELSR
jgi:branched-chain amino acid transport system permease protein